MNEHTARRLLIERDPLFESRNYGLQELAIAAFIFGWESAKQDTIRLVLQVQDEFKHN
jgi:hypothetical protein